MDTQPMAKEMGFARLILLTGCRDRCPELISPFLRSNVYKVACVCPAAAEAITKRDNEEQ